MKMRRVSVVVVAGLVTLLLGWACAQQPAPSGGPSDPQDLRAKSGYRLLQKIPVPGDGYFYASGTMDTAGRRLYVPHNTQVEVIDVDSGQLVGKIGNTRGVRGIAIASDLGRGFTSNALAASSTIFNLKTLDTIGEVRVTGDQPMSIIYDPLTKRVFTLNRRGNNITAIDAGEGKVVGTIELDSRPEFAVSDAKGRVFVSLWDREVVLQIDARKLTAGASWSPGPACERPGPLAYDQKNARLFVRCENRLMVVLDANSGRVTATVPIVAGKGAAHFDPGTRLVFSSNNAGSVTVIRQEAPDNYSVLETLKTIRGARDMAVDLKTHRIFVPIAEPDVTKMGSGGNVVIYLPGTFGVLSFGM